jgi:hypothetical protein
LIIKLADRLCNVSDFMLIDNGYAVKYWRKAESLITICQNRFFEVADSYNKEVANNMDIAITAMSNKFNTEKKFEFKS